MCVSVGTLWMCLCMSVCALCVCVYVCVHLGVHYVSVCPVSIHCVYTVCMSACTLYALYTVCVYMHSVSVCTVCVHCVCLCASVWVQCVWICVVCVDLCAHCVSMCTVCKLCVSVYTVCVSVHIVSVCIYVFACTVSICICECTLLCYLYEVGAFQCKMTSVLRSSAAFCSEPSALPKQEAPSFTCPSKPGPRESPSPRPGHRLWGKARAACTCSQADQPIPTAGAPWTGRRREAGQP